MAQAPKNVRNAGLATQYLVLGMIDNNVYLIEDGAGGVIIVDPSTQSSDILKAVGSRHVSAIFVTHYHWDHIGALGDIAKATKAPIYASTIDGAIVESGQVDGRVRIAPCKVDHLMEDGDTFTVGASDWKCILTPGHTRGGMCFYTESGNGSPLLVSGDTLFCGTTGRTDFEGGSERDMRASLRKLGKLPDATVVLPGHMGTTTIGAERIRVIEAY